MGRDPTGLPQVVTAHCRSAWAPERQGPPLACSCLGSAGYGAGLPSYPRSMQEGVRVPCYLWSLSEAGRIE